MKLTQVLSKPAIILFLLFFVSLGLRSVNFSRTITYASDQGEFLLDAAEILHDKPLKLIGIYVSTKQIEDKYFFIGSQFSYFLAFWQLVLRHDPLKITYVFSVLNSLAVVLTYLVGRKLYGNIVGIGAALFMATFPPAINYSKTIWNPSLQPLLTILIIFLILKFDKKIFWQMAVSGFLLGTELAIEYSSVILIPIIPVLIWYRNKDLFKRNWIKALLIFGFGFGLGISNLILFDLRHNFYNSSLMIKYYLSANAGFELAPHHLLPLLPLLILAAFYLLDKFIKNQKLVWVLLSLVVGINLFIYLKQLSGSDRVFGMPPDWTYPDIVKATEIIKADQPKNFNIAQVIDGDSRSFSVRYLLMYKYGLIEQLRSTSEYNASDFIYVLHYNDQDITKGGPYELTGFAPKRDIVWTQPVNQKVSLSKLQRL